MKESVVRSLKSRRAASARRELLVAMGCRCVRCSSFENLEFDCIVPTGHVHHGMEWPRRVRFYWQELLRGNLQLLCKTCHVRKTAEENCKARAIRKLACPGQDILTGQTYFKLVRSSLVWCGRRDAAVPAFCFLFPE